jgi:hypothetical protein
LPLLVAANIPPWGMWRCAQIPTLLFRARRTKDNLGHYYRSPKRRSMAGESENKLRADGYRVNFGEFPTPEVSENEALLQSYELGLRVVLIHVGGIIGFLCTIGNPPHSVHKNTAQHRTGATHNACTNFREFVFHALG